jgi:NADP-dependent 3-hydroxy acid dehydrogenase YdfG
MNLADRRILVTGASRGIGRAIAEHLLSRSARVVGIGRDFGAWTEHPDGLETLVLDLALIDELPDRLKAIAARFPDIDGIVCCAGAGRFGSLEEFSHRQIREMIDVNLVQHLYVTRTFLPLLKRRRHGDLVLLGSEAALAGGPKGAVYSAAKFALRGFAQALRRECANSHVRVCLINPGMVATEFYADLDFRPGGEEENYIRPQEVADAVALVLGARPGIVFDEINLSPLKKVIDFSKLT